MDAHEESVTIDERACLVEGVEGSLLGIEIAQLVHIAAQQQPSVRQLMDKCHAVVREVRYVGLVIKGLLPSFVAIETIGCASPMAARSIILFQGLKSLVA